MSTSFADLGVPRALDDALAARGIATPFPIQIMTIPDGLAGRDVCGRAHTGSGKTLAFGIPMVANVPAGAPGRPSGLVLVPTRELAAQVQRELEWLGASRNLRVMSCYGGVGFGAQRKALRRGVDIVVACPGRLADLVGQGDLQLGSVEVVVVDEADRMADMGFLPEVRRLLDQTSAKRQTFLFSATLDDAVDVLVRRYQRNPTVHRLADRAEDASRAAHEFWRVTSPAERLERCADVVRSSSPSIVFCRTKRRTDRIARDLGRAGLRVAAIHGDRSQGQRERALAAFTAGTVDALVATDVAARGIHVDDVASVVHFDPPADEKAYTHRSGRTARAGAHGLVVSLVDREQERQVAVLQRALRLPVGISRPGRTAGRRNAGDGSRPSGVVKWFDPRRGFGFIAREDGSDLFVHRSSIHDAHVDAVAEGRRVEFDVGRGRKGDEALDVRAA
jgi:superfamily II DNA/RNA helicase/cold shock CspA family protein